MKKSDIDHLVNFYKKYENKVQKRDSMKTAMQELIEYLEELPKDGSIGNSLMIGLLKTGLEKEKQHIIDAVEFGAMDRNFFVSEKEIAEKYYNDKYKI